MRKFKCSICGYTYDEAAGMPENGIAPGAKWEDIPEDFVCPLCGAPKTAFEEERKPQNAPSVQATAEAEDFESLRELTAGELSALCSNLAKGCEKQHLTEAMDLFYQLADYYKRKIVLHSPQKFEDIAGALKHDLAESFSQANAVAAASADRGALRALVWSEKVSRMVSSLLGRYAKEGPAMLENTKIYVCEICGFLYVGDNFPEVCPICKVPNYKISQVGRR